MEAFGFFSFQMAETSLSEHKRLSTPQIPLRYSIKRLTTKQKVKAQMKIITRQIKSQGENHIYPKYLFISNHTFTLMAI